MKQRLLIVDDEPGIVDMMASYFSSQYEVLTAYCGIEFPASAKCYKFLYSAF